MCLSCSPSITQKQFKKTVPRIQEFQHRLAKVQEMCVYTPWFWLANLLSLASFKVSHVEKTLLDEVKSEERRCSSAKVRRKKIHLCQMLEKSRNAVVFQSFVCRVKPRAQSHVVRGEIKNCTLMWREAHCQVNSKKRRAREHSNILNKPFEHTPSARNLHNNRNNRCGFRLAHSQYPS